MNSSYPTRALTRPAVILAIAHLLFTTALFAQEKNLLFNGDFEQPSTTSPPPGWAMWGASKYKVPANFTLDTINPHAGKACFRIHHPANTAGYIVSSPETAIRPKEVMQYTVTFWARSDRPGQAMFGWDAYKSLKPFIEAPCPPMQPISVDKDWKQFRFTLYEGWDFFADECRYLMLIFKAAGKNEEERTLWIDDVIVTEQPSERKDRLLNPDTLAYAPLEHRLKEGNELAIVVDADKRLSEAKRTVGGVSFHRVAGWTKLPYDKSGRYVLPQEIEDAIREMHLPMTRFYAVGDESFGLEGSIDKAAELCNRIGVPLSTVPLEFETQGATSKLPPDVWARGVKHSTDKGYAFDRWEIANEPYVGHPGRAFATADDYLEHFLAVSRAIKQAQPSAKIGLPIYHRSPAWGNYLLKKAAGNYDFVVPHYYSFVNAPKSSFEDVVLLANYQVLDEALRTGAMLRNHNPNRAVSQYDTEWGMHSGGANGEKADQVNRNGNIFGMMHRAVRLIHYLREGMLEGASSWEMFTYKKSPGFGFFAQDAPKLRSMNYWLYYHFNRHAGKWVLPIDGTAPWHAGTLSGKQVRGPITPAVATLSEDGKQIFLILANGSWKQNYPCRLQIRGIAPGSAKGLVLSHDDADGSPFLERKEDLVRDLAVAIDKDQLHFTLPAHSVVFLTIGRQ